MSNKLILPISTLVILMFILAISIYCAVVLHKHYKEKPKNDNEPAAIT